jgi:hypothetical protein
MSIALVHLGCILPLMMASAIALLVCGGVGGCLWYDFVAGGQIVPQKCLCDRIEKDGWDGCQGQIFVRGTIVSISRGETHQPIHNNQKIRQASGGTTRREVSRRQITR